jgi:hypothetical protein
MTQVPPRAQPLYRLWERLPADPMSEREFASVLLKVLDRGPAGEADATAYMSTLCHAEAVVATRSNGGIVYRKSDTFPEWPETGPGTRSWDRHLQELAEQEQADHDRVSAEVERNAPINRQRQELDAHVRQVVREVLREELQQVCEDLQRHLSRLVRQAVDEQGVRARVERAFDKTPTAQAVGDVTGSVKPAGKEAP